MLVPTLKSLLLGKKYIAQEIFSEGDTDLTATAEVTKKHSELSIEEIGIFHEPFEHLKDISRGQAICIAINTKQVIIKEVETADPSDSKLMHLAFPNTELDSFYYEIWRLGSKSVIAIARKEYVSKIIEPYEKAKRHIVSVNLGVCSIAQLGSLISSGEISTSRQEISLNSNKIVSQKIRTATSKRHTVNGIDIGDNFILGFSSVLGLLVENSSRGSITALRAELTERYYQESFFSGFVKLALCFLLAVFLANFLLFSNYFEKDRLASEKIQLSDSSLKQTQELNKRISVKEKIAKDVLSSSSSKMAEAINSIVSNMPASILLSEMNLQPLENKPKADELIGFKNGIIQISGMTVNNDSVTSWIERIERLKITEKVIISGYGKNEEGETIFSLEIKLDSNEAE